MSENVQYAFDIKSAETLEDKILRACEVVISSGLGIRGGEVSPGGNNVNASRAVDAVTQKEMDALMGAENKYGLLAVGMLRSYKKGDYFGAMRQASEMVALGWKTDAKPVNFDVNVAGARLATYVEPKGDVKRIIDAFSIGYKDTAQQKSLGLRP